MSELSLRERQEDVISHLEDGSYQQGRGALRQNLGGGEVGHCCMGVVCDRFRVLTGRGKWSDEGNFILDGALQQSLPPREVVEFFGFSSGDHQRNGAFVATGEETGFEHYGSVLEDGTKRYSSTDVNDRGGTFAEIAAIWRRPEAKVFRQE